MPVRAEVDPAQVVEDILAGQRVSEDAAALRFATMYDGRLAYCHSEGRWFEWSGSTWVRCELPTAFGYARDLCREVSAHAIGGAEMLKVKYVKAVETFSAADARMAMKADSWNRDPLLLGTPEGTVDLATGKLRPARASDFINRATAVAPRQGGCPMWLDFMRQATGDDEGMIRFLQQIAGYALTGSAKEQSLFFIYGSGGNGKGVFINTIHAIMGEYAKQAAMNTFTASKSEQHSTDMAFLAGARLVTASETAQGQRWDQQKITALTGEDMISARFMRQDFFSFKPQFTLVIVGNFKPALESVDEAMRRRFNIIPFEHKPTKPDTDLQQKLKAEWPAILQWMIEGARDWQANGLTRAKVVVERTEQYFYDEDSIQHWLDEACEDRQGETLRLGAVFESWKVFCKRNEVWAGNAKSFKSLLERTGYRVTRTPEGPLVHGLSLKQRAWEMSDGWD